jgi:uncharacterized surface protein with fasciclin (FAS1) repeats
MKNLSVIKKFVLVTILAIVGYSCNNEKVEDTPQQEATLEQAIQNDENLSLFREAVDMTNMGDEGKSTESKDRKRGYTFFAPTNAAFREFLTANGFTSLSQVPSDVLVNVLANHLVEGRKFASDFETGYLKTFAKGTASATNTLSLYVNTSAGVKLNGVAKVTRPNIRFGRSVIHIVDKVIPLPTIVTHAVANANFSSLVGALTSPGQPDFVSVLSGNGKFTVFAPTNAAFASLNTELAPGGIASVSAANLTKVLQYHVVSGANVLSASLVNNQVVTPILTPTQTFTIQLPSSGPQIKDSSNRISKIVATDVQCTNGVVHVINKVLLPTL